MMDLRLPIGIFFLLIGLVLTVYGIISPQNVIPNITQKINADLDWGILLLFFGAFMTFFGAVAQRKKP
ncbi:MAG TPA: hypothetical protein VMG59_12055 [Phycisphaerae bacterium]|nr:hypothetical protein [Phycisphaerae bacterium]